MERKSDRQFAAFEQTSTSLRDEIVNNKAKLSQLHERKAEVKEHLARKRQKLTETNDPEIQQEIRDRIRKIEGD